MSVSVSSFITCIWTDNPPNDKIHDDSITNDLLSKFNKLNSFSPLVNSKILFIRRLFVVFKLNIFIIIVDIIKKTVNVPRITKRLSMDDFIDLVKIIPNLGLFFLFMV